MIKKLKKYTEIILLKLAKDLISHFVKTDNGLVLFSSLNGFFMDNSKYLYLAMLKQKDFKAYWVAHDIHTYNLLKSKQLPVLKIGFGMFFVAIRAKFFVTTHNYQDVYYVKNKKTTVINLWHGTPLKKMGFDAKVDSKKFYLKKKLGLFEHKHIDYLCVASKHTIYAFKSSFGIAKEKILPTGQPRNDVLFKAKSDPKFAQSTKESISLELNIKSQKIALYAPTFRDKHICRVNLIKELQEIFRQNDIELIVKLHPLDRDRIYFKNPNIDIQELLIASDMLISDYSSVFFDYAILERPTILFLYDIKEYQVQRDGFYIDIESLPFYKCYDQEQLKTTLKEVSRNIDTVKISEFDTTYNRKGCASCRIIKFMKKIAKI
ncbi:CDP-glycerol:poly(glycerophosphate) glycerophosphotransferase [Desulfurella amilsii]|uniref:CDP-glycerol:poly(Glycerophosphate) glycerophosphotransferase n=1 Tax=Desulfurella amilsii TaxID=1562698 RepID=A0A1X4XV67_9BACT|nr:CDP-glycerol glycerophosphotransferase family protein [Desulfurella amilsii]OSS41420.1 CDP-glycerol:poly(glycerophosphate) glycerophosphotransferase [Desulfurella amilsii]